MEGHASEQSMPELNRDRLPMLGTRPRTERLLS
jgi:hypothetical protein